jgi:hypothetical protein
MNAQRVFAGHLRRGPGPSRYADSVANEQAAGDDELQSRAARLTRELALEEAGIGRLVDALGREGLDAVREKLRAREDDRRRLQDELLMVGHEIATPRRSLLTPEEVAGIVDELRRQRAGDVAELRAIVGMLIQRVTITGREYEVTWKPEAAAGFKPH